MCPLERHRDKRPLSSKYWLMFKFGYLTKIKQSFSSNFEKDEEMDWKDIDNDVMFCSWR